MRTSQILALFLLTLGRDVFAVRYSDEEDDLVEDDVFKEDAVLAKVHVRADKNELQLAGAGTHWQRCRIDGPEGSDFFVEKPLLIGKGQSCEFSCKSQKWQVHTSIVPSYFTFKEIETQCYCFLPKKRDAPLFKFRTTMASSRQCIQQECWNQYRDFLDMQGAARKDKKMKIGRIDNLQSTCNDKRCASKDDPNCKGHFGLVLPPGGAGDVGGDKDGSADAQADVIKIKKMRFDGGLKAVSTEEIVKLNLVVVAVEEDEPTIPQTNGGGGVVGELADVEEEEQTTPSTSDDKEAVADVTDDDPAKLPTNVASDEEVEELPTNGEDGGGVADVKEDLDHDQVSEDHDQDLVHEQDLDLDQDVPADLPANLDHDADSDIVSNVSPGEVIKTDGPSEPSVSDEVQCGSHDDAVDRAGCFCALANKGEVALEVRKIRCEESSNKASQSSSPWECAVHKSTERCVASYPSFATTPLATETSDQPEQLEEEDPATVEDPEEPAINDKEDIKNFGANLEEEVHDWDLPAAVKNCTSDTRPHKRAACICQLGNGKDTSSQDDKCESLAEEAQKVASPWSCSMHLATKQCVPLFDDGEDVSKVEDLPAKKCGAVEHTSWWIAHADFYSRLFKVWSSGTNQRRASLECNFISKRHACLDTMVVDSQPGRTPYQRTVLKSGVSSSFMGGFWETAAKTKFPLRCNPTTGQWIEPAVGDVQSCAYPMRAKFLKKNDAVDDEPEQEQVLTYTAAKSKVVVEKFKGRYALDQLWVMDANGLIKSAAETSQCLTGTDPNAWFSSKTGWFESYLFTTSCTRFLGYRADRRHEWWLGNDMADDMRDLHKAGACTKSNSCCSLAFAAASRGYIYGEASFGKYLLTLPKTAKNVKDWSTKKYLWRANGEIIEEINSELFGLISLPVGIRSSPNGDGEVMKHDGGEGVHIQEDFHLGSFEKQPKILKELKMASQDKELAVLDFWKSS